MINKRLTLEEYEDTLPSPPDNPDFELFSARKQDEIEARFLCGIATRIAKQNIVRARGAAVKRAREYEREHGLPFFPTASRGAFTNNFAKLGEIAKRR